LMSRSRSRSVIRTDSGTPVRAARSSSSSRAIPYSRAFKRPVFGSIFASSCNCGTCSERWIKSSGITTNTIDHGFACNGPHWDFSDAPLQGLYARRQVYDSVRSLADFEPWLTQVISFPEEVMDAAWKSVPPDWIAGEEDALLEMLERLFARRKRVPDLIEACRGARPDPFPNWSRI